jgi:hypothetical protein
MEAKRPERRAHKRFNVPGATVSIKLEKFFFSRRRYVEEYYPVIEISRSGIRFVGQRLLSTASKVSLKIAIPDQNSPLVLKGRIRWSSSSPMARYKYQFGVQFNPYGNKRGLNDPEILEKIIMLEKKFQSDDDKSATH